MGTLISMLSAAALLTAASAQALAAQDTPPQAPPATQTTPNTSPDPTAASSPHQREATGQQEKDKTGKGVDEAPPTTNADPSGATSPHQQDAVKKGPEGANERAAGKDKQMAGDTKPKDKLVGLIVETTAGQPVGSVVDIVRDDSGMPTHVIVAIDNETTAVPYQTASSMVRDGKVVMNQQRLAGAPKIKQTEWLDQSDSQWRTAADRYWGNTRTASPRDEEKPTPR